MESYSYEVEITYAEGGRKVKQREAIRAANCTDALRRIIEGRGADDRVLALKVVNKVVKS